MSWVATYLVGGDYTRTSPNFKEMRNLNWATHNLDFPHIFLDLSGQSCQENNGLRAAKF